MAIDVRIPYKAADPHRLIGWWAELLEYEVEDSHDVVAPLLDQGAITEADALRINGRFPSPTAWPRP